MKVVKVTKSGSPSHYHEIAENIGNAMDGEFSDIEDMEEGESFTLTVVKCTNRQYSKAAEFDGW